MISIVFYRYEPSMARNVAPEGRVDLVVLIAPPRRERMLSTFEVEIVRVGIRGDIYVSITRMFADVGA